MPNVMSKCVKPEMVAVEDLSKFIKESGGMIPALFKVFGAKYNGRNITFLASLDLTEFIKQAKIEIEKIIGIDIYGEWTVSALIWLNIFGWKKANAQSDAKNAAGINPMYLNIFYLLLIPQAFCHLQHVIDALKADILFSSVDLDLLNKLEVIKELGETRVALIRQGVIARVNEHNALVASGKPALFTSHKNKKGEVVMDFSAMEIKLPSGLSEIDEALIKALPELVKKAQDLGVDANIHLQFSLISAEVEGCTSPFCLFDFIDGKKNPSAADKVNLFLTKDGEISVLVIMRKNAQGYWCWAVAGGFVDLEDSIKAVELLKAKGLEVTTENVAKETTDHAANREMDEEVGHSIPTLIDPRIMENPKKFFQLDEIIFEKIGEISITKIRLSWEARLMFLFKEMTVGVNISIYIEE
jgi:ADP-ribose pyrophosphatase YjhB (NUDIX family)